MIKTELSSHPDVVTAEPLLAKDSVTLREETRMGIRGYAGLFMVTLATLMYEILLTRIFSVTMWYHFAFLAISLAMFGMTLGAIWIYLGARITDPRQAKYEMARASLLFAISAIAGIGVHLFFPFAPGRSIYALIVMALTYLVFSFPFFFSGTCVCLALTRFPRQVTSLYAVDLAGAATGCVLLIYTLRVTDGLTAVFVVALLASAGATWFSTEGGFRKLFRVGVISSILFGLIVILNTSLAGMQRPLLRLTWTKAGVERPPIYEKWNSFSRIAVSDDPGGGNIPFGWGLSPAYSSHQQVNQLLLRIDASAATFLTAFDGDTSRLQYLKYDITNLVHYVRPNSSVLVVGAGGGRDILSALAFGQTSALAVEINQDIIESVNRRFGDLTGHLDQKPNVTFVNDEARSYIARTKGPVDIIQISLIDTWAATAAGAFVLTENSLYTTEAWEVLLRRLTPRGMLSVSRWYSPSAPGEMYRATSLASASLMGLGLVDPQGHIVAVRCRNMGTLLVSKEPFSDQDLDTIESVSKQMQFEIVLSPRFAADATLSRLASGKGLKEFTAGFPIDISPPTDNRPFFFSLVRFRDALGPARWKGTAAATSNPVMVLGTLLVVVVILTTLCILVPLIMTARKESLRGATPHILFFAAIGFGFMLVEISQMQRLIIFLGHPTYGLSVVLFTLLLSSGLGSYSVTKITDSRLRSSAPLRLLLLLGVLMVFCSVTTRIIQAWSASTTAERIIVAAAILFPLGLTMGMAFPLGFKLASLHSNSFTAWLWGINGATSVCASVLAVVISMSAGISAAFWVGFFCYVLAFGAFAWARRGGGHDPA